MGFGRDDGGAADASTADGDGSPSSASTADNDTSAQDATTGADDTVGVKYDVGAGSETDTNPDTCECGSQLGFSYIWVANSAEGTVRKTNTATLEE